MDSGMSLAPPLAYGSSIPVEKKRNWKAMIISSVVGGLVAALALSAVATLMTPGIVRSIAGTTLAGIIWGISTKVTGNVLGSDSMTFILHRRLIQQCYRNTIEQSIGATLESVVTSIRTNNHFESRNSVYFNLDDKFCFGVNGKRHMFFDFSFKVTPHPETSPQTSYQGFSAPDLPNYDPQTTHTVPVTGTQSLVEGICHGIQHGVLVGLVSGASVSLLFLVLGRPGIILGGIGATRLVAQINRLALPSTAPDKIALSKEFITETKHQINRLTCCATDNSVGLQLDMKVWSTATSPRAVHLQNGAATMLLHSTRIVPENVNGAGQEGRSITWGRGDGNSTVRQNQGGMANKAHPSKVQGYDYCIYS